MATRPSPTRAGPVLASLPRPSLPTPTTLAVVSDPHLAPDARGTWKMLHRASGRFRAALADADRRGVDAVLSPGDLTKDGAPAEFALVDEALADRSTPFLAVPGNHDVPKPRWDSYEAPSAGEFAERYGPGSIPFAARIGGLDVVGLNSASAPDGSLGDTHEGAVGSVQLDWLDRTLPDLGTPVVCLHHGVTHPSIRTGSGGFAAADGDGVGGDGDGAGRDGGHYRVRDADALREVLVRHDVPLAGRTGFEEAYVSARKGNAHGRAIAASAASSGVVDDLLLAVEAGLPPSAYRLDADGRRPGRAGADGGAP